MLIEAERKASVAILVSDKIDFKAKTVIRDKGLCIVRKGPIQQDVTFVNICAPSIGAPKYIKQILTDLIPAFINR